jgi:Flp pilus assembly protein TadD
LPEPVGKLDGAVMIHSIKGFGCVEGLLPGVLAAALAVALAGCKTIQPTEMTASLGVTAPEGEPSALSVAERYRAHPDDADAAINYARVLRGGGQYAQALAVLERASKEHPNDRRVLAAYGRALAAAGNYKGALAVLDGAHAPGAPDWRVLSVQGAALDQMGRHAEAQRYYATALRIAPDEPSVLANLGLSYALAKDLVRAEATLRRAAAQSHDDPQVRQKLALVMGLQQGGRPGEAPAPVPSSEANVVHLRQALAQ